MRLSGRNSKRNIQIKTKVNFSAIFVIIIISVLAGYLTTKFIVYPLIGERDTSIPARLYELISRDGGQIEEREPSGHSGPQDSGGGGMQIVEDGLNIQTADDTDGKGDTQTADDKEDPGDTQTAGDAQTADAEESESSEPHLESGYGIQFGSLSTRDAAEKLVSELKLSGIEAQIVERDNTYKVIGTLFATREAAALAMGQVNREIYNDIFITSI